MSHVPGPRGVLKLAYFLAHHHFYVAQKGKPQKIVGFGGPMEVGLLVLVFGG